MILEILFLIKDWRILVGFHLFFARMCCYVNRESRSEVLDCGDGVSRTMVFANTVEAVEVVTKILERAGIECYHYHKDSSLEERAETLANFGEREREGEMGGCLSGVVEGRKQAVGGAGSQYKPTTSSANNNAAHNDAVDFFFRSRGVHPHSHVSKGTDLIPRAGHKSPPWGIFGGN